MNINEKIWYKSVKNLQKICIFLEILNSPDNFIPFMSIANCNKIMISSVCIIVREYVLSAAAAKSQYLLCKAFSSRFTKKA